MNLHDSSDTNRSASKQESVFFMPIQKNSTDRNKFHRAGPLRFPRFGSVEDQSGFLTKQKTGWRSRLTAVAADRQPAPTAFRCE